MAAELVIEHMVLIEQRQWDKRYREELINQLICEKIQQSRCALWRPIWALIWRFPEWC